MKSVSDIWKYAGLAVVLCLSGQDVSANQKPLTKGEIQTYRAAFIAADRGHWATAHRLARKPRQRLPAKILHWMDMAQRGTGRSFREIAGFIAANPDWPLITSLRRRAEAAMSYRMPTLEVLEWFAAHPPITTDGSMRLIAALLADGQTEKAKTLIRKAWVNGSFGRKQERLFLRRYRRHLSQADHVARLDRLVWAGHFSQARRAMRRVDKPRQQLAAARISLRTFRGGVDWHIRQVPSGLITDAGLIYDRVRWRRRKGRDADAFDLLKDVPADAAYPEKWWVERSILTRRMLAKGHISDAYRLASRNGLTDGARFVEAEWLSGWIALRYLNDPKTAIGHFTKIRKRVRYPISQARAAYWTGRAAEAMRDKNATLAYADAARHNTTYYGQLAAARTGTSLQLREADIQPTASDVKTFEQDERVRAVRMLDQIRKTRTLRFFVNRLMNETKSPVRQALVAGLARDIGRQDLSVRVGRNAYRMSLPMLETAYPVVAMPRGQPEKALLHAIIRQESNFETTAISRAGARGLMQLMPGTARAVAKRLRIRYAGNRLISDRAYNIRLGRAYLGQVLSRFDGSYVLAIASYNAGPSAAARWVRRLGDPREPGVDVIDWVESIPYRETRNYVQRVLENLQVYRARIGGPLLAQGLVKDLKR